MCPVRSQLTAKLHFRQDCLHRRMYVKSAATARDSASLFAGRRIQSRLCSDPSHPQLLEVYAPFGLALDPMV